MKAVNDIWGFGQLLWLFVSGWVIVAAILAAVVVIFVILSLTNH